MALLALQGEASTGDLIFGTGILLSRFKNARENRNRE
jgi:hypothetical protein